MKMLKAFASGIWKILLGGLIALELLSSVVVVGWTYRSMQGVAYRRWLKLSGKQGDSALKVDGPQVWPRWILRDSLRTHMRTELAASPGVMHRASAVAGGLFGSLWLNFRTGLLGVFNTFVVTIIPVLLWYFGWLGGWNISFYKEYEGSAFGASVSIIGIVLFIATMLYVPMAQARQAVAGEWRRFYDYKFIRRVARSQPLPMLLLAGMYSLASIPVVVLTSVLPMGLGDSVWAELSDSAFLQTLNTYFLWVSIVGFLAYWILHRLAARLYARGVYRLATHGEIEWSALSAFERESFDQLGIMPPSEERRRTFIGQAVNWVAKPTWRVALGTATLVVWFTFVAQIFVSEFFNYHPREGFLNQPLVQLPAFRHVPDALVERVRAEENAEPDSRHANFY